MNELFQEIQILIKFWSLKGERAELKSITFTTSISIISGISTDGWSFSHLQSNSINSARFIQFLVDLKKFIKIKWKIRNRRIVILLDNASFHSAKTTIEFLVRNFQVVFFLPQYSLQYASVENFFSLLKSKLYSNARGRSVSLKTSSGIKLVEEWIKEIGAKEILGMWTHNFQIISKDNKTFTNRIGKHQRSMTS